MTFFASNSDTLITWIFLGQQLASIIALFALSIEFVHIHGKRLDILRTMKSARVQAEVVGGFIAMGVYVALTVLWLIVFSILIGTQ